MNRGSPNDGVRSRVVGVASMRPRFMNRGSFALRHCNNTFYAASMRPRFMNRGSVPGIAPQASIQICFNEAPIHESGKSSRTT